MNYEKNLQDKINRLKDDNKCKEILQKFYIDLHNQTIKEIKENEIEINHLQFCIEKRI